MKSLGDGWLGTLLVAALTLVVGGISGWAARRPLEKGGILEAVNKRIEGHMAHLEAEVNRLTLADVACRERMERQEARIDQLEGELREAKQIAQSIAKIAEEGR